VASASALLPMQSASQWKRMTSFRWHINPLHTAASAPARPLRGCVGSKSPSQLLTELGNVGLSWQEGGCNRMWSSMHCMPQWLQVSAMDVSNFFVQSMLLVRWTIIDQNKHQRDYSAPTQPLEH
jgi:hypothetical protein